MSRDALGYVSISKHGRSAGIYGLANLWLFIFLFLPIES